MNRNQEVTVKTTRTGFDDERDGLRHRYAIARSAGMDHDGARGNVANGLPLHMVDRWTKDLRATFDGSDGMAKDYVVAVTTKKVHGPIRRSRPGEIFSETDPENWPSGRPTFGAGR